MNEKFNKNANVEQLTKVVLSHGEEKGLIVKDPYACGAILYMVLQPQHTRYFQHLSYGGRRIRILNRLALVF